MNSLNSLCLIGVRSFFLKSLSILYTLIKMEENYETLKMPELRSITRERRLRNYSQLRKAESIAFLQWTLHTHEQRRNVSPQLEDEPRMENQVESRQPALTKHQLKRRHAKNSKLAKCFKNMNAEIDNLKSQMEALKDKITTASKSTNARFKKKKICSMKHEVDKVAEKLAKPESTLKLLEPRVPKNPSGAPIKQHPPNRNKCIESKIAELSKKIKRAKNGRNKQRLIAKRDSLRLDLSWGPRLLEGAFNGAYRRYRIDGIEGMDVNTFFDRTRKFLIELLSKETTNRAVHSQETTWIRFIKDGIEQVELAFNSRMLAVYNLNDINGLVSEMLTHMTEQIENPALRDSKFVFDGVVHRDIDFHRLNLTRGSSYIPLPDWLAKKGAIINPKNLDMECFKWAVTTAMKCEDIGDDTEQISKLRRYEDEFD